MSDQINDKPIRMLRIWDVFEKTGIKRSSLYAKIKDGTFPEPVKLGERMSAWYEHEIDEWLLSRPRMTDIKE